MIELEYIQSAEHILVIIVAAFFAWLGYRLFIFCYDHNMLKRIQLGPVRFVLNGAWVGLFLIGVGSISFLSILFTDGKPIGIATVQETAQNDGAYSQLTSQPIEHVSIASETQKTELLTSSDTPLSIINEPIDVAADDDQPQETLVDNDEIDFIIGVDHFKSGDFEGSLVSFQSIEEYSTSQDYKIKASYYCGECFLALGKLNQAVLYYQKAINLDENHEWAVKAMFQQAITFAELGNKALSDLLYNKLVRKYPMTIEGKIAAIQLESLNVL